MRVVASEQSRLPCSNKKKPNSLRLKQQRCAPHSCYMPIAGHLGAEVDATLESLGVIQSLLLATYNAC